MIITVKDKQYEGKFNFHSVKYANEYFRKEAEKNQTTENLLIGIYSSVLMSNDPMAVRTLLEFLYAPKANGGLSTKELDAVMDEYNDADKYDELVNELTHEVEVSGFFKKQVRMWYQAMDKMVVEVESKKRVLSPEEDLEISIIKDLLVIAKEKKLI